MGTLTVGTLDFNEPGTVETVRDAVAELASQPDSYHGLRFKGPYYFQVTGSQLPSEASWYITLSFLSIDTFLLGPQRTVVTGNPVEQGILYRSLRCFWTLKCPLLRLTTGEP